MKSVLANNLLLFLLFTLSQSVFGAGTCEHMSWPNENQLRLKCDGISVRSNMSAEECFRTRNEICPDLCGGSEPPPTGSSGGVCVPMSWPNENMLRLECDGIGMRSNLNGEECMLAKQELCPANPNNYSAAQCENMAWPNENMLRLKCDDIRILSNLDAESCMKKKKEICGIGTNPSEAVCEPMAWPNENMLRLKCQGHRVRSNLSGEECQRLKRDICL